MFSKHALKFFIGVAFVLAMIVTLEAQVPPGGSGGGGGGGGAVTIASGAVASGAYSSGAFASGSFVSGALADGSIVTLGTEADAANAATGHTLMSALRQVDADIVTLNATSVLPPPLNVNGSNTAWTGLTPGTTQTGTIISANTDMTSVGGKAVTTAANGTQMVGIEGHAGGAVDAAQNAAAPANVIAMAGRYDSSLPSLTSGYVAAPEMDSSGRLLTIISNANANGQTTMSGSGPVAIASDQKVADPCMFRVKSSASFSLTTSTQVITGTSMEKTYICGIDISIGGTAQNVALVEGTGSVCGTNTFGLAGSTTAATGWQFGANGGLTKGNGEGIVYFGSADSNATAANVCLLLSGSVQTSGSIQYVQQ